MTSDPQKTWWMQKNYGMPASQVKAAIDASLSTPEFAGLRKDALAYYFDTLLASGLPRAMQAELSTEDIKALSPDSVKTTLILLIREFLRHFGGRLVGESMQDSKWVEKFTVRLLEVSGTPVETCAQWIAHQKRGEDEDTRELLTGLARQLRLDPKTLWNFHFAMCDVVEEDILNAAATPAGEPSAHVPASPSAAAGSRPRTARRQQPAIRNSSLKRLPATLAGVLVAVAIVAGNEYVGSLIFSVPPKPDMHDTSAVNAFIATLPITALLMVLFGWFLGTFVGGCVAIRLANTAGSRPAWMVALALGVAALMDLISFVHPLWFWLAALVLIPAAGALAALGQMRRKR